MNVTVELGYADTKTQGLRTFRRVIDAKSGSMEDVEKWLDDYHKTYLNNPNHPNRKKLRIVSILTS